MPATASPLDPAARPPQSRRIGLLRHAGVVVLACTLIATLLWLIRDQAWWRNMVYANAIGVTSWILIDGGASVLTRGQANRWPTGWRGLLLVTTGTLLGYVIGTSIADRVMGVSTWELWATAPRTFISYLAISLVAATAITFLFHTRHKAEEQATRLAAAQRDAAVARLAMLQSQIEPHMLFNTLANLRVLIAIDPPRAQAMLDQLIAFLRATLDGSRSGSHALADEFARIADYLALMQVRMGARLQATLDLPEPLARAAVPPLLLQPLVENAIKHGLEPQVDGGRIAVTARREGETLVLTVRDTGAGLGPPRADGARFGVHQVRERLATLHGSAARFTLQDADDAEGGTVATIHLPLGKT